MRLGMVGLPNVGKSTLFNALTRAGAEVANYPFCTIEPNIGSVTVPDPRLDFLAELYHPIKRTPAVIDVVDIAGLVQGASHGEGLGNQFLANIRQVDALIHVVRCFEDDQIAHVAGHPDPARDVETVQLELIFSDLEHLERRLEKAEKLAKGGDADRRAERDTIKDLLAHLSQGKPARTFQAPPAQAAWVRDLPLLTAKPVLYAANIAEADLHRQPLAAVEAVRALAVAEEAELVVVSAQIEQDLALLDDAERASFIQALGLARSGLDQVIQAGYRLLGLISFLTTGEDEVRAWTIRRGTRAAQAAGKIHTDMQRGFIRAEVVAFDDLQACGTAAAARERGLIRSEGRDYLVQDGDIILFRFNV